MSAPEKEQKEPTSMLRFFLAIFVATDDMPFTAKEFVQRAKNSNNNKLIWLLVSIFWIALLSIVFVSILFFSTTDTLFNVNAKTEIVSISPFENVRYSNLDLQNAKITTTECETDVVEFSGEFKFNKENKNDIDIEFRRVATGKLFITLSTEDYDSVGYIDDTKLSDCVVIELTPTSDTSFTFPVDGTFVVGRSIKEGDSRMPLLYSGEVHIADRGVLSQEYYLSEPYDLNIGDQFTIDQPTTQSSGFVFINTDPGLRVKYGGKGSVGNIKRYKIEPIKLKNHFWTKLYNDETIVILWILMGTLYTIIKIMIRFCLDGDSCEDKKN